MEFNIQFIINHIKTIQKTQENRIRNEISSIDDGMINNCFNVDNSDKSKAIKINQIKIGIEENIKDFTENHNKMILLSIIYCLSKEFRELNFTQQSSIINEMMSINIHNCIGTRNDKNVRFYKLDKKSLNHYYESNDYSNAMIDLFANIFNINIFLVEYKDGRYPIGLFTINAKFNSYKPSIILWHPNKFMYYPVSINYEFKFYPENKLFNEFMKNKIIMIDPIMIPNNSIIKDINVSKETTLFDCYDDDLNIIYKYKITPSRKVKKIKDIEVKESSQEEIQCTKEEIEEFNKQKESVKDEIEIVDVITGETEKNIDNVIITSYDRETLTPMSKAQIEELIKKHKIKTTIKGPNGKYVKKTKEQMIEDLVNPF